MTFWTRLGKILFPKGSAKMIDGGEKPKKSVGFWSSEFACFWKAQ